MSHPNDPFDPVAPSPLHPSAADHFVDDDLGAEANEPEAPHNTADPWAHRRGEPRVFAFLWSVYVFLAVGGSMLWLVRTPIVSGTTASSYSPAARTLLVVLLAGVTLLWPMTRLSQIRPEKSALGAAAADLLLVLAPLQMVVWPLWFLANWPVAVVTSVASLLGAWSLLISGVLALAFAGRHDDRTPSPPARAVWMLICIAAVATAPAVAAAMTATHGAGPAWLAMASPFTAVYDLTGHGWTGPVTVISRTQWTVIATTGISGLLVWIAAAARAIAARSGGSPTDLRLH